MEAMEAMVRVIQMVATATVANPLRHNNSHNSHNILQVVKYHSPVVQGQQHHNNLVNNNNKSPRELMQRFWCHALVPPYSISSSRSKIVIRDVFNIDAIIDQN